MPSIADRPQKTQGKPMKQVRTVSPTVTDEGVLTNSLSMPIHRAVSLVSELSKLPTIHLEGITFSVNPKSKEQEGIVSYRRETGESLHSFRATRLATAHAQVDKMSFYRVGIEDGRELIMAVNDDMHGDVHHTLDVVHSECDCEDFIRRCVGKGEKCHHLHAYDIAKTEGRVMDYAPVPQADADPVPADFEYEPFFDDYASQLEAERAARRERNARNIGRDY